MSTSGPNELATDINKIVQYSNRVLSQAEGINTDFYTINFSRLACADVHISPEGQRYFNSCLLNVSRWASRDERLQFGFGDKNLYRNAGTQLYEYEHILLAAALGEFFSEDYTALVFNALADFFENDDRPKPHLSSFKGFVQSANGLVSFTTFPLVVDDRIRLNPYQDHDRGMPHLMTTTEFVPIEKVALALRKIGDLKSGNIHKLTFVGGDVIGWFSAFIDIFMGISQTLTDKDGNILYQSNGGTACVNLQYMSPETSGDDNDPAVIWLRKPLNTEKRSDKIPPILTGRVVGEALFSKVFGTSFHRLDQTHARAFGNALGGLARSWEFWVKDENTPYSSSLPSDKPDPGSWGLGLIQTWTNWFPELRHLQGRMERALKRDRLEAGQMCHESINLLEPFCGCYICSKTKGPEDNPTNPPKDDFCIPTMMETIIVLGLSLSQVILVPGLYPSRAGILAIYKAQVRRRFEVKKLNPQAEDDGDRFKILFGDDWNSSITKRLQNVITIFSGSRPSTELPDNLMAISHEGMCAYVLKLQRGDQVSPQPDDTVIRVVMGQINWRQKTYSRLCLGCVKPPVEIGDGWECFRCEHFKDKIYVK